VTIQLKDVEEYFPVVLFIMLCKVVLSLESVKEILRCDHIEIKAAEQYCHVVMFMHAFLY